MKYKPPNMQRAILGAACLFSIGFGATVMWGVGGGFFSIGLTMFADLSWDEYTERVTGTTLYKNSATDQH